MLAQLLHPYLHPNLQSCLYSPRPQGCVHELQYRMPAEGTAGEARPTEPPPLPGVLGAVAPCPQLQHTGTNELKVGMGGWRILGVGGVYSVRF